MPFPAKIDAEAILDAAIEIVEKQGWDALSMRELGRKLGVRASSLYHHFADRQSLEESLGRRAAQALLLELSAAGVGKSGPDRIRSIGRAYFRYARANSAFNPLVAGGKSAADGQPGGNQLWTFLLHAVEPIRGDPDDTAAGIALWAFLHGFVALETAGQFEPRWAQQSFESGLNALIHGLKQKEHIL